MGVGLMTEHNSSISAFSSFTLATTSLHACRGKKKRIKQVVSLGEQKEMQGP